MECGDLNKKDSNGFIDLMIGHQEVELFERIRRHDIFRGSMSLRLGFEVSKPRPSTEPLFLLPLDLYIEFSPMSACMLLSCPT